MLTRGIGGRGYRQPETIKITRYIALHPYPDYPESYKSKGISARFCETRLGLNPLLAGLKHNNRLEQVLARSEWQDEVQEGLMLNLHDEVIEGTMSNLFIVKNQQIMTAQITQSGVNGIMRQIIIEQFKKLRNAVKETTLSIEDVLQADELFVTNSVIGVWPISRLEDKSYVIGDVTQQVMSFLSAAKAQDIKQC